MCKFLPHTNGLLLHQQILGADDIFASDIMGFSDPFVAVFWQDKLVGKTKVGSDAPVQLDPALIPRFQPLATQQVRFMTLNPRWALESFVLPVSREFVKAYWDHKKHLSGSADATMPILRVG